MNWLKNLLARLFKQKSSSWDKLDYGKPSTAGDDARRMNEV